MTEQNQTNQTNQIKFYSEVEAKQDALSKHPDCSYARVEYGLDIFLRPTWGVNLWRNEECYIEEDPPKYIEQGYSRDDGHAIVVEGPSITEERKKDEKDEKEIEKEIEKDITCSHGISQSVIQNCALCDTIKSGK